LIRDGLANENVSLPYRIQIALPMGKAIPPSSEISSNKGNFPSGQFTIHPKVPRMKLKNLLKKTKNKSTFRAPLSHKKNYFIFSLTLTEKFLQDLVEILSICLQCTFKALLKIS
jgi:hypothetical protein